MASQHVKKIILNVLATYARSLLSFIFGLFTVRWILEALGHSDYGLYGVVGGVMAFISMFNATQSATIARYYAFAIGKETAASLQFPSGAEDLRRLFNTAVSIHLILPILLIAVGYPIGVYAFEHWLNIPFGRMPACIFVFRCSLLSLLISTLTAPFTAMFIAYQLIRQLVLFSLVNVFGLVIVSYSLLHISGDRLEWYACMLLSLNVTVCLLHCIFAVRQFPACRIVIANMFDLRLIKDVLKYSGIKFCGDIAWCGRNIGNSFVTNVNFGTSGNASWGVASQLSMQAESLCATLNNAFAPAITTEEGAGRRDEMIQMAFRSCKFGSLLLLLVVVPLWVKMDYWLEIWLKNPPDGVGGLCRCLLLSSTITYLTKGHQLAIQAQGRIGKWQIFDAIGYLSAVPLACLFAFMGFGLNSIGYAHVASICLVSMFRLCFARKIVGASITEWVRQVLLPVLLVWVVTFASAFMLSAVCPVNLLGLFIVAMSSVLVTAGAGWAFAVTSPERKYIVSQVKSRLLKWRA